jgi:hypothetical protein
MHTTYNLQKEQNAYLCTYDYPFFYTNIVILSTIEFRPHPNPNMNQIPLTCSAADLLVQKP